MICGSHVQQAAHSTDNSAAVLMALIPTPILHAEIVDYMGVVPPVDELDEIAFWSCYDIAQFWIGVWTSHTQLSSAPIWHTDYYVDLDDAELPSAISIDGFKRISSVLLHNIHHACAQSPLILNDKLEIIEEHYMSMVRPRSV